MNFYFLAIMGLVFLFVWTTGAYFFWKIGKKNKTHASRKTVQPAFRLAENWIVESQQKMESLIQKADQPLSTAQHELLDLRLEAGRLPQGIKSLKLVRETINSSVHPLSLKNNLMEMVRLYLEEKDYRLGEASLLYLRTSLGEMACLEMENQESQLSDTQMKSLLLKVNQVLSRFDGNSVAGGILYFGNDHQYEACFKNQEWAESLRSRGMMIVDFIGMTVLLMSLRLSKDVDRVIQVFEQGIQATVPLVGQADKMNEALSILSSHSLKIRNAMEGGSPKDIAVSP